ncbi:MAG: hypothetical protein ACJ72Z_02825 [Pyrinomonadaceae bacterium]
MALLPVRERTVELTWFLGFRFASPQAIIFVTFSDKIGMPSPYVRASDTVRTGAFSGISNGSF